MRVRIVTPEPPHGHRGNGVTASRWERLLRELGHEVAVGRGWSGERCDALVALHARRSATAIARFAQRRPAVPLVVALTGTDLYADLGHNAAAQRSLELAWRLVVLQPLGVDEVPEVHRPKARVVLQSAVGPRHPPAPSSRRFDVAVLSHLRAVKDPLLAAAAARLLPARSRVRIVHLGGVIDPELAARARLEAAENPRYEWRGEQPRWRALRTLSRSRLLVVSSRLEGGANVVSEAVVAGVPVLASNIPGSIGLLGADYPGLFPIGDAPALAVLLDRAEAEPAFLAELAARCRALAALFAPARERAALERLLGELVEEVAPAPDPIRSGGPERPDQ